MAGSLLPDSLKNSLTHTDPGVNDFAIRQVKRLQVISAATDSQEIISILVLLEIINISSRVKGPAPVSKIILSRNNLSWKGRPEVPLRAGSIRASCSRTHPAEA